MMAREADQKSKIANSETERAEREAAVLLPWFRRIVASTVLAETGSSVGQVKGAKEDFDAKKLLPLSSWKGVWGWEAQQRRASAGCPLHEYPSCMVRRGPKRRSMHLLLTHRPPSRVQHDSKRPAVSRNTAFTLCQTCNMPCTCTAGTPNPLPCKAGKLGWRDS